MSRFNLDIGVKVIHTFHFFYFFLCLNNLNVSERNIVANKIERERESKKLSQLQGVNYKWINQKDEEQKYGFIAQEVEQIFPEFVTTGANGYKAVAYGALTPVMVEAIKELNLKVSDLQANSALTTGTGSDSLFSWILSKFKSALGIGFGQDKMEVNKIKAKYFELEDADTGDAYCVKIRNGEWNKTNKPLGSEASKWRG